MHRPYRHSLFFRLLGVGLKIYVFTALFLTIVSLIMVMFVSTDFGLAFLNTVISPMSKTGLTLGLGIAIAIVIWWRDRLQLLQIICNSLGNGMFRSELLLANFQCVSVQRFRFGVPFCRCVQPS